MQIHIRRQTDGRSPWKRNSAPKDKQWVLEMVRGVDALLEKYAWRREGMAYRGGDDVTIALVCHFGLGITVMSYLLGISPVVAQNGFFLSPTSVTTLVTETDSSGMSHFRATGVGDISHLYINGEPMSESGLNPNFEK